MAFAVFPQLAVPHNKGFAAEQGFSGPTCVAEEGAATLKS